MFDSKSLFAARTGVHRLCTEAGQVAFRRSLHFDLSGTYSAEAEGENASTTYEVQVHNVMEGSNGKLCLSARIGQDRYTLDGCEFSNEQVTRVQPANANQAGGTAENEGFTEYVHKNYQSVVMLTTTTQNPETGKSESFSSAESGTIALKFHNWSGHLHFEPGTVGTYDLKGFVSGQEKAIKGALPVGDPLPPTTMLGAR